MGFYIFREHRTGATRESPLKKRKFYVRRMTTGEQTKKNGSKGTIQEEGGSPFQFLRKRLSQRQGGFL